ncbi:uncharacterized protein LOC132759981 [Ruditapes philippinarum]|uniref:uncharacterized protein LOC132759981 n=1 Tax=Ruditapes philippinarum TaxID=129788 RepID=UPI00295B788A|nr:uncharacterized protein LOC132759981 [Ruditapes philippinarum]
MQKLIVLEEKTKQQEETNNALRNELSDAREVITGMKKKFIRAERSFDGSTYTRWEYSGYLMAGHFSHAGSSEYVCVDDKPEALEAGNGAKDETFFFFVQAACGVLKCPPY